MKKVKVLFVVDTLEMYGAERSLVALAGHFQQVIPVFVHIYCGSSLKPFLVGSGITVYSLNISAKYEFRKAEKMLGAIYSQEKPDIIHSTLFRSDLITRRLKSKFRKIPLVNSWVTNSYNTHRYRGKTLFMRLKLWRAFLRDKFTSNQVDFFIANSYTIERANRLALKISSDRTIVIYRGRKISLFENIPIAQLNAKKKELNVEEKEILLNVGRLIPTKGQLDIIRIIPQLVKEFPNTVLLIAGEGSFRKKLEVEIEKNGLSDYVKLLGARSDIPELLALADIFVFPSQLEGLSGSLIESMMAGKIIVASDIPENLECVSSETAILFKSGNLADLVNKLSEPLRSPDSFLPLGEKAKLVAKKKFDIRSKAADYEKFYIDTVLKKSQ